MGTRTRRRHRAACTSPTPRSRVPTRSRPRRRSRPRSRAKGRSTSCSPAATRSTPTPARSDPSSPSCSTCRSSPASATSSIDGDRVDARCELDDGWLQAEVRLPAVLSCAERLTDPTQGRPARPRRGARRADPPRRRGRPRRRAVGPGRLADVGRAGEGDGRSNAPAAAGPTRRSPSRSTAAVEILARARRARRDAGTPRTVARRRRAAHRTVRCIAVVVEPDRAHTQRASCSARPPGSTGNVSSPSRSRHPTSASSPRGAPTTSSTSTASNVEEDIAGAVARLVDRRTTPWAILTLLDRVGSRGRVARRRVALDAGLDRRRGRPRRRRRPARRVEAGVRRPARRRDRRDLAGADGNRARRRAPDARAACRASRSRTTRSRSTARGRVARARAHARRRHRRARRSATR